MKENLFLNTKELQDRIEKTYPFPAWVTLFEVRDGTGFATAGQAADAMAFATWPSRGLKVLGFEIKTYRSDWLRELKNPQKAEAMSSYSDEWWLVSSEGVVQAEEVPSNWGWAVGTAKGLKTMKAPAQLEPKEVSRLFLMSILRNVAKNYVYKESIVDVVEAKRKQTLEDYDKLNKHKYEKIEKLEKVISVFKDACGIDLSNQYEMPPAPVGAIVKAIMCDTNLDYQIRAIELTAKRVHEALVLLQSLPVCKAALEKIG